MPPGNQISTPKGYLEPPNEGESEDDFETSEAEPTSSQMTASRNGCDATDCEQRESLEAEPNGSQSLTPTDSDRPTGSGESDCVRESPEAEQNSSQSTTSGSNRPTPSRVSTRVRTRNSYNEAGKLQFKFANMYTEDHKGPIFCIQFNYFVKNISVFACCGNNRVSIYECLLNGSLKYLQCYVDNDTDPNLGKEQFYTCAWSYHDNTGEPILAVAGLKGIIRIILTSNMNCSHKFIGHGGEINEVKFHPTNCNLLLSASKDHSIRLWNVKTFACVAVFPGEPDGHRDSVLSVDFNFEGTQFVSCGMDHAVKFWKLNTKHLEKAIARSQNYDASNCQNSFPTCVVYNPDYETRNMHTSYIDCIRWFNLFIISKSNNNCLKFWNSQNTSQYHNISCENCDLWFLKFSMDGRQSALALGNRTGKIFVWNMTIPDPAAIPCTTLTHVRCTTTIRHTGFNRDGTILIGVGDDGTIWRYDRTW